MAQGLVQGLWIISCGLAALLCVVMLRRKLFHEFPMFFAAVAVELLFDCSAFAVLRFCNYKTFFYYYWAFTFIEVLIGFGVLREIFVHVFKPYESLRRFGDVLFHWSALVLVIVAILMTTASAPVSTFPMVNYINSLYRSMLTMECGLVIFMYLFAPHLGLTPRHRVFGIALGLGIMASCELITFSLRSTFHIGRVTGLNLAKELSAVIALSLWNLYMIRTEPERRRENAFATSEEWNYKLTEISHGNQDSAFLPSVVDTVERIMSRRVMSDEAEVLGGPTVTP